MNNKKQITRNVVPRSVDEVALLLGLWFVIVFNDFPENVVLCPGICNLWVLDCHFGHEKTKFNAKISTWYVRPGIGTQEGLEYHRGTVLGGAKLYESPHYSPNIHPI